MSRNQFDANFFDPSFLEDPYAVYDQIRAVGNVVWNDILKGWMIVGYEECIAMMSDSGKRFAVLNSDPAMVPWFEAPNMITVDGDEHHRLRSALAPLFTRSAIAHWESRVAEVVREMLQPLSGSESFDLIADFTTVPTIIVAELLGVPEDHYDDFMRWSHAITTNLSYGHEDTEGRAVLTKASAELNAYFKEEIQRHRREQPDDMLTAMLQFTGDGAMTEDEIRSTGIVLLVAGYDTTAKTMSNCLIALERNPDQRRMVANDLSLVPAAIEETMRWMGPVQWGPRRAVQDTEFAGQSIKAGEHVFAFNAAANRDPRRWDRPDEFDVTRDAKSHLGFGYGPHLCIGAYLARIEVKVALEQLLQLAPEYGLRDIDFGNSIFVRGPASGTVDIAARVA